MTSTDRYLKLPNARILVLLSRFWYDILYKRKGVEFRSPNQPTQFEVGLCLLFSLGAKERRRGGTMLVFSRVLAIKLLREEEAYTRYPVEAHACDLNGLMSKWNSSTVQCFVLDKHSVRLVTEILHLAKGGLGLVHQFSLQSGVPHFCHKRDLGKLVNVTLSSGAIVTRRLEMSWPESECGDRNSRTESAGQKKTPKDSEDGEADEGDNGAGDSEHSAEVVDGDAGEGDTRDDVADEDGSGKGSANDGEGGGEDTDEDDGAGGLVNLSFSVVSK